MTTPPKVSVVMAAYNAERTIGSAIESVLRQTFSGLELIVVDDGSRDGTPDIVRVIQERDPRVVLVVNETNLGPGNARNTGIRKSRAEWIAIIDADDRYEPERVEVLLGEAAKHGAVVLADNQNMVVGKAAKPWRLLRSGMPETSVWLGADDFLQGDQYGNWDNLGLLKPFIRNDFLDANGIWYDEQIGIGEDFYFLLSCLKHATRLLFVTRPLYNYTIRRGSWSNDPVIGKFDALQSLHARHASMFDPTSTPSTARLVARRGREIARYLRYQKIAIPLKKAEYSAGLKQALADPGVVPSVLFGLLRYAYRQLTMIRARIS